MTKIDPLAAPIELLHASLVNATAQMAALQAAVAKSNEGTALQGAQVVTLAGSPVTSQTVSSSAGRLLGFSLTETAGSGNAPAAVVNLRSGTAGGSLIAQITLGAYESAREVWPAALSFDGLYVELVAGAVIGAVFLGAVD